MLNQMYGTTGLAGVILTCVFQFNPYQYLVPWTIGAWTFSHILKVTLVVVTYSAIILAGLTGLVANLLMKKRLIRAVSFLCLLSVIIFSTWCHFLSALYYPSLCASHILFAFILQWIDIAFRLVWTLNLMTATTNGFWAHSFYSSSLRHWFS